MTLNGWVQIALYFVVLTALVVPLGRFMARVFEGERTFLSPVFRPVEAGLYRAAGVDETREQHWLTYTVAMLVFNAAGFLLVYALQRFQAVLPLNPAGMSAVAPDLAFNTAVSFASQHQLAELRRREHDELSHADGGAYHPELRVRRHRHRARHRADPRLCACLGQDRRQFLGRSDARDALRAAAAFVRRALFLVWQGVPQNIGPYVDATTLEGATQTISQGPAASQIAIKQLGTNGGGFWNANSAVPYENPTPLSNFVEMLFILLIAAALTHTFGRMVKDERQGWALYAAMSIIFLAGVLIAYWAEGAGNPNFAALGLDPANMEGKEVRFGLANSSLWAVATTAASNGSVNAMHDSFTPLGGMIPMILIQLGEIIFGGVGSGLYGMLLFVIIAVFVAGLMVGRTPEYLGKKIEAKEVKMAMLAISDPAAVDPRLHGGRDRGAVRLVEHPGPGAARLQRDHVSLHVADRQQRLRLRAASRAIRSGTTRPAASRC